MAADLSVTRSGLAYNFGYNTGTGQSRTESGSAGNVAGSYSYIDANGDLRVVQYTAGPDGFKAIGDTGVDRRTAAAAAAMAALAPKAPPAPAPVAPTAPIAPIPTYVSWGIPGAVFMSINPAISGYSAHW